MRVVANGMTISSSALPKHLVQHIVGAFKPRSFIIEDEQLGYKPNRVAHLIELVTAASATLVADAISVPEGMQLVHRGEMWTFEDNYHTGSLLLTLHVAGQAIVVRGVGPREVPDLKIDFRFFETELVEPRREQGVYVLPLARPSREN